jgi:hypothetical protein
VLTVIWRSAQDLCSHPFTGHPYFRLESIQLLEKLFLFSLRNTQTKDNNRRDFFYF